MVCMCDIHTTKLVSLGVSVNVQGLSSRSPIREIRRRS